MKTGVQSLSHFLPVYQVFQDIQAACDAATRLEEIALGKSMLTSVSYLDMLIESERKSDRPNKTKRLEQLNLFEEKAELLKSAREDPDNVLGSMSKYEATVMKAIEEAHEEAHQRFLENERKRLEREETRRRLMAQPAWKQQYQPNGQGKGKKKKRKNKMKKQEQKSMIGNLGNLISMVLPGGGQRSEDETDEAEEMVEEEGDNGQGRKTPTYVS